VPFRDAVFLSRSCLNIYAKTWTFHCPRSRGWSQCHPRAEMPMRSPSSGTWPPWTFHFPKQGHSWTRTQPSVCEESPKPPGGVHWIAQNGFAEIRSTKREWSTFIIEGMVSSSCLTSLTSLHRNPIHPAEIPTSIEET
jgi:hypothetical protein